MTDLRIGGRHIKRTLANGRFWPVSAIWPTPKASNLRLLRHFQGVVDLDAEIADCALELRVSEK